MKSLVFIISALFLTFAVSGMSIARDLKTYVSEFNVSGVSNSGELKVTLQGVLSSRLNPSLVQLVEKQEQADIQIRGSYAQFGKMFSLDALIKNKDSGTLVKVFDQGELQEDVLPGIVRLARKIEAELAKWQTSSTPVATSVPAAPPVPTAVPLAAPPVPTLSGVKESTVILQEQSAKNSAGWSSAPFNGAFKSIALGRTLASGARELFIADDHMVRAYRKNGDLTLISEIVIPAPATILAIDTGDLDGDGTPELYITVIDREFPASCVYQLNGSNFTKISEKLPWFFRGIGNDYATRTIFAQELNSDGTFYGDIKELSKSANRFVVKNPLKLPSSANIFSFTRLGKDRYAVLNGDHYLVIYAPDGSELWRSSEKYGGSESFYDNELLNPVGTVHRTFLEQRVVLAKDGTLLVPGNESSGSFGNLRNFNKHTLFAFEWTGAVLKEKWHTPLSPGYLADYAFDQASGEVVLLEVVQKEGVFSKGKTVITTNRID